MKSYPKSIHSKQYPEHIRNHPIFKEIPKPVKIFPRIGLKNSAASLSSMKKISLATIDDGEIVNEILTAINNFAQRLENIPPYDYGNTKTSIGMIYSWASILQSIVDEIECYGTEYKIVGQQVKLYLPSYRYINKLLNKLPSNIFKLGEDRNFFTLIKQFQKYLIKNGSSIKGLSKRSLNNFTLNKTISGNNTKINVKSLLPSTWKNKNNLKVCFSSSGNKGFWDIATMSMRGIHSCMRWDNGNSNSLVGSISDAYAGVIYLTDNVDTKYGKKMLARCVVRFVLSGADNIPSLFLEKVYAHSSVHLDIYNFEKLQKIFASYLSSKTKLPIMNSYQNDSYGHYIPQCKTTKLIEHENYINDDYYDDDYSFISYIDSDLHYKSNKSYLNPEKINIKKLMKMTG